MPARVRSRRPKGSRPNQWHDTENEGERRHQDRSKPQPRGFHGRGPAVTSSESMVVVMSVGRLVMKRP